MSLFSRISKRNIGLKRSDVLHPYQRFKRGSFVEQNLVIKAPNKFYRMTPGEVFSHNIGPGIYNDFVRSFLSRSGLGFTLGATWFSPHMNAAEAIGTQMTGIVGGRIGMAVGGLSGGKVAGFFGKKLMNGLRGSSSVETLFTRGGTLGGAAVGMLAGTLIANAGLSLLKTASNEGKGLLAPDLGYGYQQTRGAVTARQRSLLAMKTSRFNVRSVLGNEAYRLATGY